MSVTAVFAFLGGIGLFLLGMRRITAGLKVAAGETLRAILSAATRSQARGVASGVLITTLVQSSSAVIFATIGFVNAGLMTLQQSVGVIFGANVGTTLTSWLVALVGLDIDLQALAMPAVGVGMALWVTAGTSRRGALGQALAGFGLFFLGIDILRGSFAGLDESLSLARWGEFGGPGLLVFVAAGVGLTVLMQSSSAALAVTLTAAAGGVIPFSAAAAMVIGANVGTTSTAVFAALDATAAARRAAAAHVAFNVITAVVALLTLPALLWLIDAIGTRLGVHDQIAAQLAIFHTATKLLGLTLMWPATGVLVRQLEKRFRSTEEDTARPQHLDRNVLATPALAMDALGLELHRMSSTARKLAGDALNSERPAQGQLAREAAALERLGLAVGEFASSIHRSERDPTLAAALPHAVRVAQYLQAVAEQARRIARLQPELALPDDALGDAFDRLRAEVATLLQLAGVDRDDFDTQRLQAQRELAETHYQQLKAQLLRAGTAGTLTPRHMAHALELLSALHRAMDQTTKGALYLRRYLDEAHNRGGQDAAVPDSR